MSKELVIGSNRHETKVAVLEDDQLVELYFQRANEYSLAGSIHKGRVTRVLPGMQSAFVDLGLERDTFLYVSDFFDEVNADEFDTVTDDKPLRNASGRDSEGNPERGPREERGREERDRGRDDRGGRRDRGGRQSVERPAVVTAPETYVAPPIADDSDEEEEPSAPVTLPGEVRAAVPPSDVQVRSAGADRGGDRNRGNNDDRGRNRRSRRRRGRGGRGIPDNKYAQPSAEGEAAATPSVSAERIEAEEPAVAVEEQTPVSDVIILPGESLAKYRRQAEPAPARSFEQDVRQETDHDEAAEEDAHEDIAAEAESIELADKVFGHKPAEEPVIVEEEKIAEVRNDHAATEELHASSLPVSEPEPLIARSMAAEAEAEAEFEAEHVHDVRQERLADISWSPERRAAEELFSKVVPIRDEEYESEAAAHLHHELTQAEAFEAEVDQLDSTGSIASIHDLAPEVEEALETGDFDSGPAEGADDGAEGTQTASLREQGGRFPHRSRRMRRRRGGS